MSQRIMDTLVAQPLPPKVAMAAPPTAPMGYAPLPPDDYFRQPYYVPGMSEWELDFIKWHYRTFVPFFWDQSGWMVCFPLAVLYVAVIFGVQRYMKHRERYDLRGALAAWNFLLGAFSLVGLVRTWPEMTDHFSGSPTWHEGLYRSICSIRYSRMDSSFWAWLFIMSKAYEMGDTMFIVLRKQKLIFLHWYHHLVTMLYCFYSYGRTDYPGVGRWFYTMNFAVHALMYTYFGLKACRVSIPRWVAMTITTTQLAQMVVGTVACCLTLYYKAQGLQCFTENENLYLCLTMYAIYVVLFAHFFYTAYFKRPKASATSHQLTSQKKQNGAALTRDMLTMNGEGRKVEHKEKLG